MGAKRLPMIICNFATNNKLNTIDIMNMTKKLMTMLLALLACMSASAQVQFEGKKGRFF